MDRLTEQEVVYNFSKLDPAENDWLKRVQVRLSYYEDLEEQGRLQVLPCKPRDKVWLNEWWSHYSFNKWEKLSSPIERNVIYFSIESDGVYAHVKDGCINVKYFGEIAFLSREEAEAALKNT